VNWLFIFLGVAVIVIFIAVRQIHQHAVQDRLRASQKTINEAMRIILPSLSNKLKLAGKGTVKSTLVADARGRDILAFEFKMPVEEAVSSELVYFEIMDILKAYATGHNIERLNDELPAFVVADVWYETDEPILHVIIAHVLNDATYAYLADLKKSNQTHFDSEKRV